MARKFQDWLGAYVDYAQFTEAPTKMHFWSGVSAIAGALRRKVWIDEGYYKWFCNMYICLVAPPGVVSKSTTAGLAMDMLREVPGIKFGPNVVTWPALVSKFAESTEAFEYKQDYFPMSPLTLEASEFGNLLDPQDRGMVDLLVSLWDGKQGEFTKVTKGSGEEKIENPWINLLACTTPSWIAANFPEYMLGGGFVSRTIFVYADKKRQLIAYPSDHLPTDMGQKRQALVDDLTHIAANVCGEYKLQPAAKAWGRAWYAQHVGEDKPGMDSEQAKNYLARKQTLMHKVAMVLAASQGDSMTITAEQLSCAHTMLTDLESDMNLVFSKVGKSDTSFYVDKLIEYVHKYEEVTFEDAYRHVHTFFPSVREFEDALLGAVKAGYIKMNGSRLSRGRPPAGQLPPPKPKG